MTRQWFKKAIFSILIYFFGASLFASFIQDADFGYSLDIPEGYQLAESTDDGMSYHFTHPNIPVELILKLSAGQGQNQGKGFSSAKDVLAANVQKLKGKIEQDSFLWNGSEISIGTITFTLDKKYSGWGIGAPVKVQDYYLTLFCYAPEENEAQCQQFIMSTLNSLCIDEAFYNTPGPVLSYAFPNEGKKQILLEAGGKKIQTEIDKTDEEASQFLVDMEYGVLTLYANHKMWKEAWQRYYRMIYRDSFGRLSDVCSDLYESLYPVAQKKNGQNADIAYAQLLLSWVQNFEYRRADDPKKSDFTALPCAICKTGSDCDSRSLLICTLLKACGIESILLISPEYSHAMVAAKIEAPGQKYQLEEENLSFIMGETTAKVTWGMIAQEHADRSKWIPVILP